MNAQKVLVTAEVDVTPEALAALFWEMASDKMADFFAELDRIADGKLCFQMAWVVQEIQERADRGDHRAQVAFQTMLSHAQGYAESAIDLRCWNAKREIDRMTKGYLSSLARIGGAQS